MCMCDKNVRTPMCDNCEPKFFKQVYEVAEKMREEDKQIEEEFMELFKPTLVEKNKNLIKEVITECAKLLLKGEIIDRVYINEIYINEVFKCKWFEAVECGEYVLNTNAGTVKLSFVDYNSVIDDFIII